MKKSKIITSMATFGLGAVTGMMFAPKKGEDLREDVKCTMKKAAKKIENTTEDVEESIKDTLDSIGERIENLQFETTSKNLSKRGNEIKKDLEKIIKDAKDKKDDILENTASKLKEILADKLNQVAQTLED